MDIQDLHSTVSFYASFQQKAHNVIKMAWELASKKKSSEEIQWVRCPKQFSIK